MERNVIAASGRNPAFPKGFNRALRWPRKSDIKPSKELLDTYLAGTPLALFDQTLIAIPMVSPFEHQHIVVGSGHGKSQTLRYLICQDLEAAAFVERSVVLIDSQGDLIRNIASLKEFAVERHHSYRVTNMEDELYARQLVKLKWTNPAESLRVTTVRFVPLEVSCQ